MRFDLATTQDCDRPGNVRGLESCIKRAVILAEPCQRLDVGRLFNDRDAPMTACLP